MYMYVYIHVYLCIYIYLYKYSILNSIYTYQTCVDVLEAVIQGQTLQCSEYLTVIESTRRSLYKCIQAMFTCAIRICKGSKVKRVGISFKMVKVSHRRGVSGYRI